VTIYLTKGIFILSHCFRGSTPWGGQSRERERERERKLPWSWTLTKILPWAQRKLQGMQINRKLRKTTTIKMINTGKLKSSRGRRRP
jgi:hypothetical protein